MEEKTATNGAANVEPQGQQEEEKIIMTKEEYQKTVESYADKRVNQALNKWEQSKEEEVERLARLSADERQREYEQKKKAEIEEKYKELNMKELNIETRSILSEKLLPTNFSKFLIKDTAHDTQENIKMFEKAFKDEVQREVEKRLKMTKPETSTQKNYAISMNDLIRNSRKK